MPQDNDAVMLQQLGNAVTDLEVKFRGASLEDRIALRPALEEMINDYTEYRFRLLKEGVIVGEQDLAEMKQIQSEVNAAAAKQDLMKAVARTVAFIATKI